MTQNQNEEAQTTPDDSEPRIVEMSAKISIPVSTRMGSYLSRNLDTITRKDEDNGR